MWQESKYFAISDKNWDWSETMCKRSLFSNWSKKTWGWLAVIFHDSGMQLCWQACASSSVADFWERFLQLASRFLYMLLKTFGETDILTLILHWCGFCFRWLTPVCNSGVGWDSPMMFWSADTTGRYSGQFILAGNTGLACYGACRNEWILETEILLLLQ